MSRSLGCVEEVEKCANPREKVKDKGRLKVWSDESRHLKSLFFDFFLFHGNITFQPLAVENLMRTMVET